MGRVASPLLLLTNAATLPVTAPPSERVVGCACVVSRCLTSSSLPVLAFFFLFILSVGPRPCSSRRCCSSDLSLCCTCMNRRTKHSGAANDRGAAAAPSVLCSQLTRLFALRPSVVLFVCLFSSFFSSWGKISS